LPHTWTTPLPQHTPHEKVEIPLGIDAGTIPNQFRGEGGAKLGITTGISYFSHPGVFGANAWGWLGNYTNTEYTTVQQSILSAGTVLMAGLVPKISERVKMNISLVLGASYEQWTTPRVCVVYDSTGRPFEQDCDQQAELVVPLGGLRLGFMYSHPSDKWQIELGYMAGLGGSLFTIFRIYRIEISTRVMLIQSLSSTTEVPSVSISLCYFLPISEKE